MKTLALSFLLATMSACSIGGPAGYVRVDQDAYDGRFISANGVVFARRTIATEEAGTLDFWATVIGKELATTKGYVLQSEAPLGAGRSMLFTTTADKQCYFLAIFVSGSRVIAYEASGTKGELEKELPALKEHIEKSNT